jgi:GH25 family lysozyme M1 (1,4-beta-N-acetylmuramidase)
MDNYLLLVDTYEEERQINEQTLVANNIAGMIIRLNHIEGGHHLDENFRVQWAEAGNAGLLRVPYFVYNPWVDGQENFTAGKVHHLWNAVMVDIEVTKPGYPPSTYATEVAKFCQFVRSRWNFMIYTGEAYLHLLSSWPTNADYWWAQYPFSLYPPVSETRTWAQVRAQVDALPGPFNADKIPGRFKMWRASGTAHPPGGPNRRCGRVPGHARRIAHLD